jgi:hypothetical protein
MRDRGEPARGDHQAVTRPTVRRGARAGATWSPDGRTGREVLTGLQLSAGNEAVSRLVRHVQRDVGWPDAKGLNKGGGHALGTKSALRRIPLAGLANQSQDQAANKAKTGESAAGRAVVWVHDDIDVTAPVQVLVHLHGLTSRSADPFAGWRENNADPDTEESAKAKKAGEPNPVAGKVRDIERDRIGPQLEQIEDPQVMAVLPQGSGLGGAAMFGRDFNPDTMVSEILTRLAKEGALKETPKSFTIMLSAHSAGGAAVIAALPKRMTHVGGVILFDALYGGKNKAGAEVSPQRDALLGWIRRQCKALGSTLRHAATEDERTAAIAALPGVRGYWEAGYSIAYRNLQSQIRAVIRSRIPAAYRSAVSAKFVIKPVKTSHDRIVGGAGTKGVDAAPLRDALTDRKTFTAQPTVARQVQRAPSETKTGKVKITWTGGLKNAGQLQPVLDKHPADLSATVKEGGKVVATGDSPATLEVPVGKHAFRITPTAAAPGDYFLGTSTTVTVKPGGTTDRSVTLPFNRGNVRFTERTWEVEGIDVTKANDVDESVSLFGKSVIGGLNTQLAARVAATNTWFSDDKNVTPADRTAAQASIVSLVGRVKRAQSRGTYSNHSTGVAIDINPSAESLQNWHVKKTDSKHVNAMKVFSAVVALPKLTAPGGKLDEFKDFDLWKEKDRDRLLAASQRFNALFPDYLVDLATQADPEAKPAPAAGTVMALTGDELAALAGKASAAKKKDVATALREVARSWYQIRAWVGGYVITSRKKGGEAVGMLRADFDAAAAKDSTLKNKGELTGMIALHPAVVKALTENGWTWMVDYRHDNEKDFMHFEDREAQRDLKKK